jgi:hypothetical protein
LVDRLSAEDPFVSFLSTYSPETQALTDMEPAEFVAELHQRFLAHRIEVVAADAATPPVAPVPTQSALFFISYSRTTDLARAQQLRQTLVGDLGVAEDEIWFDRQTLEPGDQYAQRILEGIRGCRYFLPLVSHAATERARAFVFREWEEATNLLPEMNRKYLLPLVVDGENRPETYSQPSVATWRERKINFGHAPDGIPDPVTRKSLQDLIRAARVRA